MIKRFYNTLNPLGRTRRYTLLTREKIFKNGRRGLKIEIWTYKGITESTIYRLSQFIKYIQLNESFGGLKVKKVINKGIKSSKSIFYHQSA